MKKIFTLFAIGASLLTASLADEIQLPHITVFGTATTEAVPDQMLWSVKVENKGMILETVASDHTSHVQAVLALLSDLKLDKTTIQTSRMEFGENWEYRSNSRVRDGYVATTSVAFRITNFELYKQLWFGLAKMSSVSVESVAYDHTKRIDYQNQTRQKALIAAKEKAIALAKTLGTEIGEPLLIEEDLSINSPWAGNSLNNNVRVEPPGDSGGFSDALAPGTIAVKMRVKTAFRLHAGAK